MTILRVIAPAADVGETPDTARIRGNDETELVFGEEFFVEEEKDGWSRGYCVHDGYKGWIPSACLGSMPAPTHVVTAARTDAYRDPWLKSPRLAPFSFGSLVTIVGTEGKFHRLTHGGFIYSQHLSPVGAFDRDHVATALKFVNTPYYWGGRSGFGIDCSGLVQVSLARAGIKTERDKGPQSTTVGQPVATPPQRGDLVYFNGAHVGIMVDEKNILSADGDGPKDGDGKGFEMRVRVEPLETLAARHKGVQVARRVS